jgi:PAS domain S-box-containing protein
MIKNRMPAGELRPRAEERIGAKRRKPAAAAGSAADAQRIMHELEVHQAELEIQNEELRTARAENEAALARYTELFDFAPIGYATLSSDGIVRDLNHAGARVLGRSKARVIGSQLAAFVAAPDLHLFRVLLQRAADSDALPSCELELSIGGRAVQVRLTATAVAREDRTILVAFEDVSERVAREAQLARTEQALREANQRKDEFLAMLSHELRNPLGPISGSLFILDHTDPESQQALNARAIIERQVVHLTRLIEDLLDVTRITRGKIELQREDVELAELVRRTLDDHRAGFESRGLRLEGRLDEGPFWLRADPARLVQVVSNLLGNAEKFTPRGGTVTVSLEVRGPEVVLRVRDTGVGIAPELIGGLFEPFAQGPQTMDRSRGGLGLGLAMVKGLIELHGGSVQLSSEGVGRGAEVTVSLPLAAAPAKAAGPAARATAAAHRVLVIEDNVDAATCLYDGLSLMGHEVRIVHRGAAGLEVARTFRPEVVLCDIGLPEMDGYEVAAAFRADPALRGAHLIALSGYARPEDRQRAVEAGFDHHVAKPPAFGELARLIDGGSQPDGLLARASQASSSCRHPPASASGRAAASSAGARPAACESPPSRQSSGAARPARRRSVVG